MSVNEPGLAAERTVLAWNRTALVLGALAALMIRVVSRALPIGGAVGVAVLLGLAGAVGGLACLARAARLRELGTAAGSLPSRSAALVVAAVVVTGLTACAIGILEDGLFVL